MNRKSYVPLNATYGESTGLPIESCERNRVRLALDAAEKLKARDETVALFLADQRMPLMSGIEFLTKAIQDISRREEGSPHRLRRHERGHRGD